MISTVYRQKTGLHAAAGYKIGIRASDRSWGAVRRWDVGQMSKDLVLITSKLSLHFLGEQIGGAAVEL